MKGQMWSSLKIPLGGGGKGAQGLAIKGRLQKKKFKKVIIITFGGGSVRVIYHFFFWV